MFSLLLFLLAGALFGNAVVLCLMLIPGMSMSSDLTTLVAYPIMFIPPMIYASVRSQRNMMFDDGRSMDSSEHFGKSGLLLAIMVMLATVAMSFLMDIINSQMPPMPEWLESTLKGMTQGNVIINFICRNSTKWHEAGLGDSDFRSVLRFDPHESLAGCAGFRPRLLVRLCILQDGVA